MRVYLRLGRVSNLPTVWTNCAAASVLAGGKPDGTAFALLAISLSLLYISGMYLNDAFDQEFDRKYRAERPIPSGEISGRNVYGIGFGLMAAGLVLLAVTNPRIEVLALGLALAGLIVYYDYRHKKDPASPLIMALCRALVYLTTAAAVASAASALSPRVMAGAAMLTAYMIGLTYVAKQENLKEVKNLWPLALLAAPFLYAAPVFLRFDRYTFLYAIFLVWVLYSMSHLVSKTRRNIPRAVVSLIAGISLLDGTLIASVANEAAWSWAGIAGFLLTLLFQRYVPGT